MMIPPPRPKLTRRQFFLATVAAGVTAALGDTLLTSAPWLDYNRQVRQT
jgi:hypothetical protein